MQLVKFCDIIEIAQLGREKFSFGNFGLAPHNNNVLATALGAAATGNVLGVGAAGCLISGVKCGNKGRVIGQDVHYFM